MKYRFLPPQDTLAILTAKLNAIERDQAALREELQELRDEISELKSSESWIGGTD